MSTTKRWVAAFAVLVVVASALWWALGSVTSWSAEPRGGSNGNVNQWNTHLVSQSRPVLRTVRGANCWINRSHIQVEGGNSSDPSIIEANVIVTWGVYPLSHGHYCQNPRYNTTWDDGPAWWLWDAQGVVNVVKGSGRSSTACQSPCDYTYRRFYFKFSRTFEGIGQNKTVWIATTVRGDGSCTFDKYEGGNGRCHVTM